MQINPGGLLDTKDVVGRDAEIARYWHVLERQGLVLSAERRIGKTHIVLKMRDECRSGYLPFYQDLEDVHSITDLIQSIYTTIGRSSNTSHRLKAYLAKWSRLLPRKIAGVELPRAEQTWQVFLDGAFDDPRQNRRRQSCPHAVGRVSAHAAQHPTQGGCRRGHANSSITCALYALPTPANCASCSPAPSACTSCFDHCASRATPTTRSTTCGRTPVPPLAIEDARNLAAALLEETRADPAHIPDLASRIAGEVGGFPYYVHHVVDQLDQLGHPPTAPDVAAAAEHLVYDSSDPANLGYYLNRLETYYTEDERSLALTVLDTLAGLSSPASVPELLNLCRHSRPSMADEQLRDILAVLSEDHHIERREHVDGTVYDFRWQLVKRWWKATRL